VGSGKGYLFKMERKYEIIEHMMLKLASKPNYYSLYGLTDLHQDVGLTLMELGKLNACRIKCSYRLEECLIVLDYTVDMLKVIQDVIADGDEMIMLIGSINSLTRAIVRCPFDYRYNYKAFMEYLPRYIGSVLVGLSLLSQHTTGSPNSMDMSPIIDMFASIRDAIIYDEESMKYLESELENIDV
jgi:hypothetical protein